MNETKTKKKTIFVQGPILPEKISSMNSMHTNKHDIGAHNIFLGQVRADKKSGQRVHFIEYSAYEAMTDKTYAEIKEALFGKYQLTCMHVMHSLGQVPAGALSLVVFVSSVHRNDCIKACNELVERIKKDLPVWGKEVFDDDSSQWKSNTIIRK